MAIEMTREQALETLDQVAEVFAETSFTDEYKKEASLEQRKIEGMGIAISNWTEWDSRVVTICFGALENSNFHALAGPLWLDMKAEAEDA